MLGVGLVAAACGVSRAQPQTGRQVAALDGIWEFRPDPEDRGLSRGWQREVPSDAVDVQVPAVRPAAPGALWYWRRLSTPKAHGTASIRLRFHGIGGKAQVWLEGESLGSAGPAWGPVEVDVTSRLKPGAESLLAVRIGPERQPGMPLGLWQSVDLVVTDEAYLDSVAVDARPSGWLMVRVQMRNASQKSGDAELRVEVREARSGRRVGGASQNLAVSPGRNTASVTLRVNRPKLWSPDESPLYMAEASLRQGRDVLDSVQTPFGFRDVAALDGRILVNGIPAAGRAVRLTLQELVDADAVLAAGPAGREVARLRDAGVRLVVMDGPPAPRAFLDAADIAGVMVAQPADEPAIAVRDSSHPSVVLWLTRTSGTALPGRPTLRVTVLNADVLEGRVRAPLSTQEEPFRLVLGGPLKTSLPAEAPAPGG